MELRFAARVQVEVDEAVEFYEGRVEGLGSAFLEALKVGVLEVVEHPKVWRVFRGHYRRYLISGFPYGILYRIDGDIIFVATVMHLHRNPEYLDRLD